MNKPITEKDFENKIVEWRTESLCSEHDEIDGTQAAKEAFELAKRMAADFAAFISNHRLDFQTASGGRFIGLDMKYYTPEEIFELYQKGVQ